MEPVTSKPTYRDKVYRFLIEATPGKRYEISKLAKSESRDEFIQVLKDFIAYRDCEVMGFEVEISSDFKAFYKIPQLKASK